MQPPPKATFSSLSPGDSKMRHSPQDRSRLRAREPSPGRGWDGDCNLNEGVRC